ncbi:MAG: FHA domain-containing protein [Chloroflexota bacterium]
MKDPTGRIHELKETAVLLGRAVENEIVITSKRVSREHAQIRRDGWRIILEDLGSTNGTFFNGERLQTAVQLRDGDQIKIGDVVFTFHDPDVTHQDEFLPSLEIDGPGGVVRLDRQELPLSPKEFTLLTYLADKEGVVCSKDEIGTAVWPEYQAGVYDYQIENLIRRLRSKIEPDPSTPKRILTIRGRGYKYLP